MKKHRVMKNPIILWLMICFLFMTGIISIIACYFAQAQKKGQLLNELDVQMLQVANEYKDITEDFWGIYLPVFEASEDNFRLTNYFQSEGETELLPMERFELLKALSHMAIRDECVQWIAVYSPLREKNYIYFPAGSILKELPSDFSYIEELKDKTKQLEIYREKEVRIGENCYNSIAIAGGTPGNIGTGSIIVGYDITELKSLCEKVGSLESLRFDIFKDNQVLFSSGDDLPWPVDKYETGMNGVYEVGGEKWYVQIADEKLRGEKICYAVKWSELVWEAGKNMGSILGVTVLLATLAVGMYLLTLKSLTKEVKIIRDGLDVLGQNQLDFQIEENFNQPELEAIAEAINQMAGNLKENIERMQEYEQRQIKSELQELQAKFNPHFLYNTLEIFRARCYQNGDDETAELIAQTAAIFRGFISSKTFIAIQEELAFSRRYLALFKARYGETVRVLYDIDTEVLQYGIIRNVFQPLIENYFEHGYNSDNKDNYILFKGCIQDDETILFTIEDNGLGMEERALKELNEQLRQPILSEKESYGLRNLHQRLRLFYGEKCGITLKAREQMGLVIEMVVLCKRCEEIR